MNEEVECFSCGIDYQITADEILVRDGVEPKFCPFCGASEQDRELLDMFNEWDDEDEQ